MIKKIVITIALIFVIGVSSGHTSVTVRQAIEPGAGVYGECGDGTWDVWFDFTISQAGWEVHNAQGVYVSGTGYHSVWMPGPRQDLYIINSFVVTNTSFSMLKVDMAAVGAGSLGAGHNDWFSGWNPISPGSQTFDSSPNAPSSMLSGLWINTQTDLAVEAWITGVHLAGLYTSEACPFADLDPLPDESQYKPVVSADLISTVSGALLVPDALSTFTDTKVYASVSGEITSIEPGSDGYTVVLESMATVVRYDRIVSLNAGLHAIVNAGCWLGVTSTITDGNPIVRSGRLDFLPTDIADPPVRLDYSTWLEPSGSVPCGGATELMSEHCVTYNPTLERQAEGWERQVFAPSGDKTGKTGEGTGDQVVVGPASVILDYGQEMQQMMVLDDATPWYLTLYIIKLGGYSKYEEISYTIGDASGTEEVGKPKSDTIGVSTVDFGPITIGTPDAAPDLYELKIRNEWMNTSKLQVQFACLHAGDMVAQPDYCYFANYSFDEGSTSWSEYGSPAWHPLPDGNPALGAVVLHPGDYIQQAVDLDAYLDGAATYQLSVVARLADSGGLGYYGAEQTLNQTIEPGINIGDLGVNEVVIAGERTTEFTVAFETSNTGDLRIESDNENDADIELQSICLSPKTGVWPGGADDAAKGKRSDDFVCAACENQVSEITITIPLLEFDIKLPNVVSWLTWMWCQLRNWIQCDLFRALSKYAAWIVQVRDGIGYFTRWLGAAMARLGTYLIDLLMMVAVHLVNAIVGIFNGATLGEGEHSIIQDLYDMLGFLLALITGSSAIVDTILNLVAGALQAVMILAQAGLSFAHAMIVAAGEPAADIGSSSCSTPGGVWVGVCMVYEILAGVMDILPATSTGIFVYAGCIGIRVMVWSATAIGGSGLNV
jgi:hypothetical protein